MASIRGRRAPSTHEASLRIVIPSTTAFCCVLVSVLGAALIGVSIALANLPRPKCAGKPIRSADVSEPHCLQWVHEGLLSIPGEVCPNECDQELYDTHLAQVPTHRTTTTVHSLCSTGCDALYQVLNNDKELCTQCCTPAKDAEDKCFSGDNYMNGILIYARLTGDNLIPIPTQYISQAEFCDRAYPPTQASQQEELDCCKNLRHNCYSNGCQPCAVAYALSQIYAAHYNTRTTTTAATTN